MVLLSWSLGVTCLLLVSSLSFITAGNVEKMCTLLCNDEAAKESQCAYERGCYEPAVKNDSARITECLDYCWLSAGRCFKLCSDNFNSLLNECFLSGATTPESAHTCFNERFLELKNLTLQTSGSENMSEEVLKTSEEDTQDEGPYVFKPYDSTSSLLPALKTLLVKESTTGPALAENTGYKLNRKYGEQPALATGSDHLDGPQAGEFTEDFMAFRELFLKNASQLQKQLDSSLEKEVLKQILAVYKPLLNGYKDEFGIEHLARQLRGTN